MVGERVISSDRKHARTVKAVSWAFFAQDRSWPRRQVVYQLEGSDDASELCVIVTEANLLLAHDIGDSWHIPCASAYGMFGFEVDAIVESRDVRRGRYGWRYVYETKLEPVRSTINLEEGTFEVLAEPDSSTSGSE
jgi:hypothetical protein